MSIETVVWLQQRCMHQPVEEPRLGLICTEHPESTLWPCAEARELFAQTPVLVGAMLELAEGGSREKELRTGLEKLLRKRYGKPDRAGDMCDADYRSGVSTGIKRVRDDLRALLGKVD